MLRCEKWIKAGIRPALSQLGLYTASECGVQTWGFSLAYGASAAYSAHLTMLLQLTASTYPTYTQIGDVVVLLGSLIWTGYRLMNHNIDSVPWICRRRQCRS